MSICGVWLREGGEGVVDGGGSCWALLGVVGRSLNVLVPRVLIVGYAGGWVGKVAAFVVEHHGSLGFVLITASHRHGGEAMHVGW